MDRTKTTILAFDTSNYTTSLAAVSQEGKILLDQRMPLSVKQGERGLRQSHALFLHMENLPVVIKKAFETIRREEIIGIAVSSRPRPSEDSYMPVFKAGVSFGQSLSTALSVPYFEFSHQEGHLAAATYGTPLEQGKEYLAFHMSGGTCELLFMDHKKQRILIVGKSLDISFGQLIDRVGVALGMNFPAGAEMDKLATAYTAYDPAGFHLTPIPVDDVNIHLSGIESQLMRIMSAGDVNPSEVSWYLFREITNCLIRWMENAVALTGCSNVLFAGGVAASRFLRDTIKDHFCQSDKNVFFGQASLSSDNAVGTALLGGRTLWRPNR